MSNRREDPKPIGVLLEEVLAENGYLTVCKENSILRIWPSIVGKEFAQYSQCERVENGIVYIRVASSPWRQEVAYLKETLLKRIQTDFDCPSIKDIIFY
jgi:hypothetical protein